MTRIIQNLFHAFFWLPFTHKPQKIEKETFYNPLECITRAKKVIEIQINDEKEAKLRDVNITLVHVFVSLHHPFSFESG